MSTLHLAKSEVNKYCYHILNNTWVLEHFHYGYLVITLLSLLLLSLVCACTHVCSLSSFVLICPPRLAIYFFSFVSCVLQSFDKRAVSLTDSPSRWTRLAWFLWHVCLCFIVGAGLDWEPWRSISEQTHRCREIAPSGQGFAETSWGFWRSSTGKTLPFSPIISLRLVLNYSFSPISDDLASASRVWDDAKICRVKLSLSGHKDDLKQWILW